MMDKRRWLDSRNASDDVLALLESARAPRPIDAATRARSRRRLAALSAVPAAAGAFFWLQSAAFGALLGAAVSGAALVAERFAVPSGQVATKPAARGTGGRARSPLRAPTPSAAPGNTLVSPDTSGQPPAIAAAPPKPRASVAGGGSTLPDITREARLLERARASLESAPAQSLRVLEQHAREFDNGTLRIEREFLRVEALLRLGRVAEARKRAEQLRSGAPGHLYEQRLQDLLEEKR